MAVPDDDGGGEKKSKQVMNVDDVDRIGNYAGCVDGFGDVMIKEMMIRISRWQMSGGGVLRKPAVVVEVVMMVGLVSGWFVIVVEVTVARVTVVVCIGKWHG